MNSDGRLIRLGCKDPFGARAALEGARSVQFATRMPVVPMHCYFHRHRRFDDRSTNCESLLVNRFVGITRA